ncbi:uncharacterized protein ACNLHF_006467 [Anomaloglossus baeobatrachus]
MKTTLVLLICMAKYSSEYPLWHVMQMYNTIGTMPPQQPQHVNPGFVMTPAEVLQNQISQILPMHPHQILSQYFLTNHLMQPAIAPKQLSPTYPIFGNLLPLFAANTQGLLSGSDSEEGIVSGVLMVPVDLGLQDHLISIHQAGVSISGPDSGIPTGLPALNPVGQQGNNITMQTNDTVLVESELPGVKLQEWPRDDAPGAGIIRPTYSPPPGLWKTLHYVNPAVPSDNVRGDMSEGPSSTTENWILCNSYSPDHHEFQGLARGDRHVPENAPDYVVFENVYRIENQMERVTS